jgi:hypothetical protein
LNEQWVQDRIAEDPSLLGLGDLVLKDKERRQPHAGRLDLLFQDVDTDRKYEVELQLGRTDESHIIRTIEYWDIEKRRYPQSDHCAVIVAEDITSRFLNVISLFNSAIPIIAIQMTAFHLSGQVALVFTTVLNELSRGLEEEDEEIQAIRYRSVCLQPHQNRWSPALAGPDSWSPASAGPQVRLKADTTDLDLKRAETRRAPDQPPAPLYATSGSASADCRRGARPLLIRRPRASGEVPISESGGLRRQAVLRSALPRLRV